MPASGSRKLGAGKAIASSIALHSDQRSMQIRNMVDMWNQRMIIEPGNRFAQEMRE